jgi:anthranilate phosphoribosyltransferase
MTILNDILDKKPIPQLRPILLNTAALLWIADEVDSIEDGIAAARTSIESGAARDYFDEWIIAAQAIAKEHGDTGR